MFVVACVEYQNVAFFDGDTAGNHLRRVKAVIGDQVRNVHNNRLAAQVAQGNIGDGACARVEGAGADQMCARVVAPLDELAVGPLPAPPRASQPFEEVDLQGHFARPRRGENAQGLGQVVPVGIGEVGHRGLLVYWFIGVLGDVRVGGSSGRVIARIIGSFHEVGAYVGVFFGVVGEEGDVGGER